MPTFFDTHGNSYELTHQIGRGGEGTVFACPDDETIVAKIYHEPIDDEKAGKLRWMADNADDQLLKVAAWILDTLHDAPGGKIVGFIMPSVRAKEIHELYSLKSRRVHFPQATWKFLIHTAGNVARAFYALHRNSHIMGDVNHGNCVVLRDGTVKLIDCDSYSISRGDFRYRCDVGVGTHLAPELQGADLGSVERIESHDHFGLAVIIFQLLFLGRHPFAGTYLGDEDKSLEDCIKEHRFAYGTDAHLWKVKQPPGTLSLSAVTPRLAVMFERAFLTYDRPDPREWIEALADLSEKLAQCTLHVGHHYHEELSECPWCELETETGLMLFPFVKTGANGEDAFDIFTIESLVSNLSVPRNLPARPVAPALAAEPSVEALDAKRKKHERAKRFFVIQFLIMVIVCVMLGSGPAFFVGALFLAAFLVNLSNIGRDARIDYEVKLDSAQREWKKLEQQWFVSDVTTKFDQDLVSVRGKIGEHLKLQQQGREKIKLLRDGQFHYKLDVFLSNFKLNAAVIDGVPDVVLEKLESRGFATAADLGAYRLNESEDIGEDIRLRLLQWRADLEKDFEIAETELPEADRIKVSHELSGKRNLIEREIESLVGSLRLSATRLHQRSQFLTAKVEKVGRELAQAEADLSTIGTMATPVVVLVSISAFVWITGMMFENRMGTKDTAPMAVVSKTATPMKSQKRSTSADGEDLSNIPDFVLPKNFTEYDAKELDSQFRMPAAKKLLLRARENSQEKGNLIEAEKDLRLALILIPRFKSGQYELADVLYKQKRYKESVAILDNFPFSENGFESKVRFLLGANYLKLKYFREAQLIFNESNTEDPYDFEVTYNLGQAYKGLEQYHSAVATFKAATLLRPNDAETRYEYAFCLHKIGSESDVKDQYQILFQLNPKLAEKLRSELSLKNVPKVHAKPKIETKDLNQGDGTGY